MAEVISGNDLPLISTAADFVPVTIAGNQKTVVHWVADMKGDACLSR